MPRERFVFLFSRFLDDTITPGEKLELAEEGLLDENQRDLESLLERAWEAEFKSGDMTDEAGERIMQEILKKKSTKVSGLWIRRIAVAAALMGVLIGGYQFFFHKKNVDGRIAAVKDIAPGSSRATLKLGNGATIVLDSAANGRLVQQGNATITKLDSGQLAYTETNGKPSEILYNTLSTPRGGEYQLILPDGTKAWLNAASSITYPTAFTEKTRSVKITGEVYFEVKHNPSTPFMVEVAGQTIEDIGTEFNINAYPEEENISTTLINGSIKIVALGETHILIPGQQEIVGGGIARIKNSVDIARVIAWQRGQFEFNETTLPVIMRQISRWYDVDINFEGPISNETFGGGISRNLPLSDVLKLLEANGVKFRLDGKQLFVKYQTVK